MVVTDYHEMLPGARVAVTVAVTSLGSMRTYRCPRWYGSSPARLPVACRVAVRRRSPEGRHWLPGFGDRCGLVLADQPLLLVGALRDR